MNRAQRERLAREELRRGASKRPLYAFDVDDTLDVSNGPVTLAMVETLHEQGHTVGLAGNWPLFLRRVNGWQGIIAFMGPDFSKMGSLTMPQLKARFLRWVAGKWKASEYVLVGNERPDGQAAREAGWRFIREAEFACGAR